MGKLIVIEGLDGSGKGTQTALLYEALSKKGANVRKITFPNYESPAASPVKMYLAGEFGKTAADVNAYAASVLYSVDRFASYKADWGEFYDNGGIVLADRYTTSNAVHQCSKLEKSCWDEYLQWLFDLEYTKIAIPKPDLVIYLSVAPNISQKLLSKRYLGDNTKKDIHERDEEYLKKSRNAADYCANACDWKTVICSQNDEMRTIESIQNEVLSLVLNVI